MSNHHQVLIVGGGTAGISIAALLRNKSKATQIAIVDPSDVHYYQPIWTLVGAGVFPKEESRRNMEDFIPEGVEWIKNSVVSFDPENNRVGLNGGESLTYDYLIVAAGIKIEWEMIPGLKESVAKPGTGVCSNYTYETVDSTWQALKSLKKGRAIFTQPATKIKCGGAPQKICYLASHYFQKNGTRNNVEVVFASSGGKIFGVPKYRKTLEKVIDRYGIKTMFKHDLLELRPDEKIAVFEDMETGEKVELQYDMIHVTPPQGAHDFLKNGPLTDEEGWVTVDKETMQHDRYANVFACGDCSNLPTSKTGAAIRKQAPVLVENLLASMDGRPLKATYDGYTSCPVVTGYGRLVMAEFDYNQEPKESFPFDQGQERYSMYALKAYGLPRMYWHGMLRGREF